MRTLNLLFCFLILIINFNKYWSLPDDLLSLDKIFYSMKYETLPNEVKRHARQLPTLNNEVLSLENELKMLKMQYQSLYKDELTGNASSDINYLEKTMNSLIKDKIDVETVYNSLNQQYKTDDEMLTTLDQENTAKQTEYQTLSEKYKTLDQVVTNAAVVPQLNFGKNSIFKILEQNSQINNKIAQSFMYVAHLTSEVEKRKNEFRALKDGSVDPIDWTERSNEVEQLTQKSIADSNNLYGAMTDAYNSLLLNQSDLIRGQIVVRQKIDEQFKDIVKDLLKQKIALELFKAKNLLIYNTTNSIITAMKKLEDNIPELDRTLRTKKRERKLLSLQKSGIGSDLSTTCETTKSLQDLILDAKEKIQIYNIQLTYTQNNITYYTKLIGPLDNNVNKQNSQLETIRKKLEDTIKQINDTMFKFIGPDGNSEDFFKSILNKRVKIFDLQKKHDKLAKKLAQTTGEFYDQVLHILGKVTSTDTSTLTPNTAVTPYVDYLGSHISYEAKKLEVVKDKLTKFYEMCKTYKIGISKLAELHRRNIAYGETEVIYCEGGTVQIVNAVFRTYLTKAQITQKMEDINTIPPQACSIDIRNELQAIAGLPIVPILADFAKLEIPFDLCKGLQKYMYIQLAFACSDKDAGPEDVLINSKNGLHLHNFVFYGNQHRQFIYDGSKEPKILSSGYMVISPTKKVLVIPDLTYKKLEKFSTDAATSGIFSCVVQIGLNICYQLGGFQQEIYDVLSLAKHLDLPDLNKVQSINICVVHLNDARYPLATRQYFSLRYMNDKYEVFYSTDTIIGKESSNTPAGSYGHVRGVFRVTI
ncbi:hypothetical protein SNEBB_000812 [Seison nebaliae]|nr:hypothetical protein SNEBB_000812 [Seison nebaliae]